MDTVKDSAGMRSGGEKRRGETLKADKIVTECRGALLSSDNIKFHNEGASSCDSFICGICGN